MDLIEKLRTAKSGAEMDLILAEASVDEPAGSGCNLCDLGHGTRGMDRCAKCDGTGSVFVVGTRTFPNTERGYMEAVLAKVGAS